METLISSAQRGRTAWNGQSPRATISSIKWFKVGALWVPNLSPGEASRMSIISRFLSFLSPLNLAKEVFYHLHVSSYLNEGHGAAKQVYIPTAQVEVHRAQGTEVRSQSGVGTGEVRQDQPGRSFWKLNNRWQSSPWVFTCVEFLRLLVADGPISAVQAVCIMTTMMQTFP